MKQGSMRVNDGADAIDRVDEVARRRRAKLALVRPVVAPAEVFVQVPDERPSFESAALTVMHALQRFTFYR